MKKFHVIVDIDRMPTQFDVSEIIRDGDLAFRVETAGFEPIIMSFIPEDGRLRIIGEAADFWKGIENDLDVKIQFQNL